MGPETTAVDTEGVTTDLVDGKGVGTCEADVVALVIGGGTPSPPSTSSKAESNTSSELVLLDLDLDLTVKIFV